MQLNIDLIKYPSLRAELVSYFGYEIPEVTVLLLDNVTNSVDLVISDADGVIYNTGLPNETNEWVISLAVLIKLLEENLTTVTPSFVAMFSARYAESLAAIDLMVVETLTPKIVEEERGELFTGIKVKTAFEYTEAGVSVGSEYLEYDNIGIGVNPDARQLPSMYEVVMIGRMIAFNQSLPAPAWSIPYAATDQSFGRQFTGGLVARPLNSKVKIDGEVVTDAIGTVYDITSSGLVLKEQMH